MPSTQDYALKMREVLARHCIKDFMLVGHSYGTLLARALLDDPVIAPKIDSLVLCDSVTNLLHLPYVAYNITRREPVDTPPLQIQICKASRDCVIKSLALASHMYYVNTNCSKLVTVALKGTPAAWNGCSDIGMIYLVDRDHELGLLIPADAKKIMSVVVTYAKLDGVPPTAPEKKKVQQGIQCRNGGG
ncbi:hypothetical protein BJ878DRAFT_538019 [Calycina marina]|uniref:AB hydrolase-1 domain-containing protein n=1 Tax=Calycina marina TaxID=1763456 RepID=A0A9P7ZB31_9HELO|nr:hypothetical protein BJ878DRAFT_538019 [Calycina marina]